MVGGTIKVSPVLSSTSDIFQSYFPTGEWVSLQNYDDVISSIGEMKTLSATSPTVKAHLKPGAIIPY